MILLGVVVLAGLLLSMQSQASDEEWGNDMLKKRAFNLDDVNPEAQGGLYKKDYDVYIEKSADKHNVPFALIKAHAIMESSLNPRAFRDENPSKRMDRVGWASRGLGQILWWPKSNRLARFGYPDSALGVDGEKLYDPEVNADLIGAFVKSNLTACGGNLRDAINMYNTGKKEAVYQAPHGYVDKVEKYYNTLLKG